jgi:glycosyltransferase involved in cell wall biosynthesis
LSRNFGQQAAITCGYAFARGDAVICLDADLQDPPEVVPEMVARWRAGFDVVVICCVLHHCNTEKQACMIQEGRRILTPDGHLIVFEHNPVNPVTRLVVRQTPMDEHAELLPARRVEAMMKGASFRGINTRYVMFFPPRWPWMERAERLLARCPLGGQYVVAGRKSCSSAG